MSEELKPCPFCGGEPQWVTERDQRVEPLVPGHNFDVFIDNEYFGVKCVKCDVAQTNPYIERKYAIAAWNTRTSETELATLRAHNEVLQEALNQIAVWNDGPVVGSHFDEPGSAQTARNALAQVAS